MLGCVECGAELAGHPHVERVDDPTDPDTPPELALFCVACSEREFGTVDAP